jgi:1-deoxy-D-xylulose-5-phosphate reductoisomerase
VLNAANEEAVAAFLDKRISFLEIAQLNAQTMHALANTQNPIYEDYVRADAQARAYVQEILK